MLNLVETFTTFQNKLTDFTVILETNSQSVCVSICHFVKGMSAKILHIVVLFCPNEKNMFIFLRVFIHYH